MTRDLIAIAASAAEEERIERVLADAGIAYETRLDPMEHSAGVCFLGCGYAVDADRAEEARRLLRHAGVTVVDR